MLQAKDVFASRFRKQNINKSRNLGYFNTVFSYFNQNTIAKMNNFSKSVANTEIVSGDDMDTLFDHYAEEDKEEEMGIDHFDLSRENLSNWSIWM